MTTQNMPVDIAMSPASCWKTLRIMMEMTQMGIYFSDPMIYLHFIRICVFLATQKDLSSFQCKSLS